MEREGVRAWQRKGKARSKGESEARRAESGAGGFSAARVLLGAREAADWSSTYESRVALAFSATRPLAPPASMLYIAIVFCVCTGAHIFSIEVGGQGGNKYVANMNLRCELVSFNRRPSRS